MSKAVLISIRPKWCELIASLDKSIEVRKTRPKIETPFKCYMYMSAYHWAFSLLRQYGMDDLADRLMHETGKVIGEFVCDRIIDWHYIPDPDESADPGSMAYDVLTVDGEKTCMEYDEFEDYGKGAPLFGWHISDLVIYDEPKKLSEFVTGASVFTYNKDGNIVYSGMKRPPQSWCYVEELP